MMISCVSLQMMCSWVVLGRVGSLLTVHQRAQLVVDQKSKRLAQELCFDRNQDATKGMNFTVFIVFYTGVKRKPTAQTAMCDIFSIKLDVSRPSKSRLSESRNAMIYRDNPWEFTHTQLQLTKQNYRAIIVKEP